METEYYIKVSSARMPSNCWGRYQHIALMEVEKGTIPKMISPNAKGVVKVVRVWRNRFVGTTDRCAASRAKQEAIKLMEKLKETNN